MGGGGPATKLRGPPPSPSHHRPGSKSRPLVAFPPTAFGARGWVGRQVVPNPSLRSQRSWDFRRGARVFGLLLVGVFRRRGGLDKLSSLNGRVYSGCMDWIHAPPPFLGRPPPQILLKLDDFSISLGDFSIFLRNVFAPPTQVELFVLTVGIFIL
jgi:hypothetical protein